MTLGDQGAGACGTPVGAPVIADVPEEKTTS